MRSGDRWLLPGVHYYITLDAFADRRSGAVPLGSAWVDLIRPLPPTGGACTATPTTGTALVTAFSVACAGWVGTTPPLRYSFSAVPTGLTGIAAGAADDRDWMWTPAVSSAVQFLYLPAGNHSLWARIMDADGCSTTVLVADLCVNMSSGNGIASLAVIDGMMGQLVRLGQVTQLLILAHAVALEVNDQALRVRTSAAAAGGGRRLLAQSSLQYRQQV